MKWLLFVLPSFSAQLVYGLVTSRDLPVAAEQTYDTAPIGLRAGDSMSLGRAASLPLSGLRVAVDGVHFEGNLGDEMETTPVLKQLYDWGIAVDAYSSTWKDDSDPGLRLHSRATRPLAYVQRFFGFPFDPTEHGDDYDVVIEAPGPCIYMDVCDFKGKKFAFGSSVNNEPTKIKECYDFIWPREVESFNFMSSVPYPDATDSEQVMLSADLSHSFEPIPAAVKYWQDTYANSLQSIVREKGDYNIVVSRTGKSGRVNIVNGYVEMLALRPGMSNGPMTKVKLPLSEVVFATSDPDQDQAHFAELEKTYGVDKKRLILLQSIEEMFGLFTAIDKVQIFSDRYHPAVAGHMLGKNVTVLGKMFDTDDDALKMRGLNALIDKPPSQLKEYNIKAFASLYNQLLNAQRRDHKG